MTYEEFFRERQEARYASARGGSAAAAENADAELV